MSSQITFYSVTDADGNVVGLYRDEEVAIARADDLGGEWEECSFACDSWGNSEAFVRGRLWAIVEYDGAVVSLHDNEKEAFGRFEEVQDNLDEAEVFEIEIL